MSDLCVSTEKISHERQKELPVCYRGLNLGCGYRLDFLVENIIVVELKYVEKLSPLQAAQNLIYMRLADVKMGLLINFNATLLKKISKDMGFC